MSAPSIWTAQDLPMQTCKRYLLVLWLLLGGGCLLLLLIRTVAANAFGSATADVWGWFLPNIVPTLSLMIGVVVMDDVKRRQKGDVEEPMASGFLFRLGFGLSVAYLTMLVGVVLFEMSLTAIDDPSMPELTQKFGYLMGPFQGLIVAALGAFFTKG